MDKQMMKAIRKFHEVNAVIKSAKESLETCKAVIRESDKQQYVLESIAESLLAIAMTLNEPVEAFEEDE